MTTASAHFTITLAPGDPALPGTGRSDFTKEWTGDLAGTSAGVMLSAGDPEAGTAGYVALETFTGTLAGQSGSFTLQQLGSMGGADDRIVYEVVPGSGTGDLAGLTGSMALGGDDGHDVTFDHRI